jgi:hypothetical protein
MKIGGSGKDNGLKKPYRKPLVDSRESKPDIYGDYGRDEKVGGDCNNAPGSNQGRPGRGHRDHGL